MLKIILIMIDIEIIEIIQPQLRVFSSEIGSFKMMTFFSASRTVSLFPPYLIFKIDSPVFVLQTQLPFTSMIIQSDIELKRQQSI